MKQRGIIESITSDMSGLQTIRFKDGEEALIENFGVRQLVSVLDGDPFGKEIIYEVDRRGDIMTSFEKI